MNTNTEKKTENLDFSADVARLLDIVANALYTNHDVFLRELISNAADACDRLRYEAIQSPGLIKDNTNFRIHIYKDTDTRTLTIVDNGIGMTRDDLIENLGTIAKSGTAALMEQIKASKSGNDNLSLIGQFGVGFYAGYMVADRMSVVSRKAGQKGSIWVWESDGRNGFDVRKATKDETGKLDGERGTAITLHLKEEGSEFLLDEKIKQTVQQYSDHIDFKIFLNTPEETGKGEGQPLNKASAIWRRSKSEVDEEEYKEFYKHLTLGFDEPLMTSHWHAEGAIDYKALLFVPMLRPWDLYDPGRKQSVKLYVRRVLISDNLEGLVYPWMRFLRGVVDSEDLPLNISRETLQYNPVLAKIRSSVTRRVLSDLDKLSREDEPGFLTFWGQFGPALKEGLYDAAEHREKIFKVCRFHSTFDDNYTTLDDYVGRMPENQKEIYYISGENLESLRNSPQIEGFKSRSLEVLFFIDTIDDFWLQQVQDYKGKPFKSVTKGDIDLEDQEQDQSEQKKEPEELKDLVTRMTAVLSEDIESVRISKRLTDSPVCLVASDTGVDMHMERVLKIHQNYAGSNKPILEINPDHSLIEKLAKVPEDKGELFQDISKILLDQARIIEGQPLKDPADFARRMSSFVEKTF